MMAASDGPAPDRDRAQPRLTGHGLSCRRGDAALFSNVDFELHAGELLFVRGRNGCGKTTLLRAICGLTEPARGRLCWDGRDIRKLDEEFRSSLLFLGHRDAVKEELTPMENLAVQDGLRGEDGGDDARLDALERMGLAGREDIPVRHLSQGQRRRVALARLLLSPAKLWVLDEPLTALDVRAVEMLLGLFREHLDAGGLVVATSHQPMEGLRNARALQLD